MKSIALHCSLPDESRPFSRRFSLFVQLADLQSRHPCTRITLPRFRRALAPSRHDIIETLRAAERADWSHDITTLRRFPSL